MQMGSHGVMCFCLVTMFKGERHESDETLVSLRAPVWSELARKIKIIRTTTHGVMVTYMTLNHRVLSSNLSEWTIWGYNLTAKVAGF